MRYLHIAKTSSHLDCGRRALGLVVGRKICGYGVVFTAPLLTKSGGNESVCLGPCFKCSGVDAGVVMIRVYIMTTQDGSELRSNGGVITRRDCKTKDGCLFLDRIFLQGLKLPGSIGLFLVYAFL